jgi:hypothetical protein
VRAIRLAEVVRGEWGEPRVVYIVLGWVREAPDSAAISARTRAMVTVKRARSARASIRSKGSERMRQAS